MNEKHEGRILLVDDDQRLLDGLRRSHRKSYELHAALGAAQALELLQREGNFAVVVSDFHMPLMDGITFLGIVRERYPDTVRVLLTGNADQETAIRAVNKGEIFRFLSKPCEAPEFAAGMDAALEQHRLRRAERDLLEHTLRGSIQVLIDVLALVNPTAFGRATRVRGYARHAARRLGATPLWQVETAALLSQIGCVALPPDLIERVASGETLAWDQQRMLERHPEVARRLLSKIPRLEGVAEMVAHQGSPFRSEEQGPPCGEELPLGGRILAAALALDELVSLGATVRQAIETLRGRKHAFDPKVLTALEDVELPGQNAVVATLHVSRLKPGMILHQDICNEGGTLVAPRGHELTVGSLERLLNYVQLRMIPATVRVRVPGGSGEGVQAA